MRSFVPIILCVCVCIFMPMCCWLLSYHMFIHFILLVMCYHACYMPLDLCVYVFAVCLFFKICLLWFMSYCVTGANMSSLRPLHPRKLADITAGKAFGIFWYFLIMFAIVLKNVTVCDWYDLVQVLDRRTFMDLHWIYILDENAVQS